MGLTIHKEQDRNTELNDMIAADLRERAQRSSGMSDPDFAEESDYIAETKSTSRFGWVWFVLIGLAMISLVAIILI